MDLRKMDKLTLRRSKELELPGVGRSVFDAKTTFTVGRVNSRFVYLYTDGGTGLGMALECRVRRRDVTRDWFEHERKTEGIAARHDALFGEPHAGNAQRSNEAADTDEDTQPPQVLVRRRAG